MRAYVWTYRVKPEWTDAFRHAYSSTGDWAQLFLLSREYRGTDLLQLAGDECRYMTIDYFDTPDGRARFLAENDDAYATLDRQWQDATIEETFVGEFEIKD